MKKIKLLIMFLCLIVLSSLSNGALIDDFYAGWSFEGNGTEILGNFSGTGTGEFYLTGVNGSSFCTDTDGDTMELPDMTNFNIGAEKFSFSLWFNYTSDEQAYMIYLSDGGIRPEFYVRREGGSTIQYCVLPAANDYICEQFDSSSLEDGVYHNLVLKRTRQADAYGDFEIWVDGVNQTLSAVAILGTNLDMGTFSTNSVIGSNKDVPKTDTWKGCMDELYFWKRELSTYEINVLNASNSSSFYPFPDSIDTTPTTQTPTPTNLLNISQNNESIYLNWSFMSESEKYLIYINGTNTINTSNSYINLTDLSPNTNYGLNITAYNTTYDIAESNFSNTINTKTYLNVAPPSESVVLLRSINTNISNIYGVINMLGLIILYLGFLLLSYWMITSYHYIAGLVFYGLTLSFDIYLANYFRNLLSITNSGYPLFIVIAGLWIVLKIIAGFTFRYQKSNV